MRLSEAIFMGDSLKKPTGSVYLERDGSCGCAIGGAFLAIGDNYHQRGAKIVEAMSERWPWVTPEIRCQISNLYFQVIQGRKTIEDVADYVRSIEPAEEAEKLPEPTMDDGYLDDEPLWSDTQTEIERQNSIKGR